MVLAACSILYDIHLIFLYEIFMIFLYDISMIFLYDICLIFLYESGHWSFSQQCWFLLPAALFL